MESEDEDKQELLHPKSISCFSTCPRPAPSHLFPHLLNDSSILPVFKVKPYSFSCQHLESFLTLFSSISNTQNNSKSYSFYLHIQNMITSHHFIDTTLTLQHKLLKQFSNWTLKSLSQHNTLCIPVRLKSNQDTFLNLFP
jgi:hypothetical protein